MTEMIIVIALVAMCLISIGNIAVLGFLVHNIYKSNIKASGINLHRPKPSTDLPLSDDVPSPDSLSPVDEERRRRSIEVEKAFEDLMNYNADIAYGITQPGMSRMTIDE